MFIDSVITWVQEVTGPSILVLIAPLNAPPPEGDYITVSELSPQSLGYPIRTIVPGAGEDLGTATVTEELFKSYTLEFNAYAANGEALLDDIVCASYAPDGLCVQDFGDVRPLSFLEDTGFTPRYQREITFGTTHERSTVVQTAETVHVTGTFDEMNAEVGEAPAP